MTPAHLLRRLPRLDRRGVALPIALLALVAISLMVTTALITSTTEAAISDAQQGATQSLYSSDAALEAFVASRAGLKTTALPQPLYALDTTYTAPKGGSFNVAVNRLAVRVGLHPTSPATMFRATDTYSIVATPSGKGRAVGALYSVIRDYNRGNLNISAGASIGADKIKLPGNSATLSGIDTSSCATGNVAGLALAQGVNTQQLNTENVEGGVQQTTISKAAFATHLLSGMTPEDVAALAEIKWGNFTGGRAMSGFGDVAGTNARTSGLNWGCPTGLLSPDVCLSDPDRNYFPVVAIRPNTGNTVTLHGHGQGVLVVLGNARFNAGFRFKGVVVVVGELTVNGGTNVFGALVGLGDVTLEEQEYADSNGEETTFNGQSLVKFDRCQLNNAIAALANSAGAAAPQTFSSRTFAWFEVIR